MSRLKSGIFNFSVHSTNAFPQEPIDKTPSSSAFATHTNSSLRRNPLTIGVCFLPSFFSSKHENAIFAPLENSGSSRHIFGYCYPLPGRRVWINQFHWRQVSDGDKWAVLGGNSVANSFFTLFTFVHCEVFCCCKPFLFCCSRFCWRHSNLIPALFWVLSILRSGSFFAFVCSWRIVDWVCYDWKAIELW